MLHSILLFVLLFYLEVSADKRFSEQVFEITINEGSEIRIKGSTNVNDFNCDYIGQFEKEKKRIIGKADGLNLHLDGAIFRLKVHSFDCKNSIMTKEFVETLKGHDYPEITMEIKQIQFNTHSDYKSNLSQIHSVIEVRAAGKVKNYKIPTTRKIGSDNVQFKGNFNVLIEDFGIIPPTHALGLIKVNSTLNIDYIFIFDTQ